MRMFFYLLAIVLASCSNQKIKNSKSSFNIKGSNGCSQLRSTFIEAFKSNVSPMVISQQASKNYNLVSVGGPIKNCNYMRYAMRTLKKPYEGKKISQKQYDKAAYNIATKREY